MLKRLFRGFAAIFGGKVITMVVAIFATPVLVRLLGSEGYGDFAFIVSSISILMIVTNSGIFTSIRKYLPEQRDDPRWKENVFGFYFRLAMLLTAFMICVVAVLNASGVIESWLAPRYTVYFYLVCGLLLCKQCYRISRSTLMALGNEPASESIHVARRVLVAVFGISLAYYGWHVTGVLVGQIITYILLVPIGYVVIFRDISIKSVFRLHLPDFPRKELFEYNVLNIGIIAATVSLYHVDIVFLRMFQGSQATGIYRASLQITEFFWFVPITLGTVFIHSISELWSKNKTEKVNEISARSTRYTLLLTVLLALGVSALAEPFVLLYFGTEFERAVIPLLILLPGTVGYAVARQIYPIGQAIGDITILIYATGASSILNLLLNLLLVPRYGLNGAAVATTIGYGSMLAFHIWGAWKIGFDPLRDLRVKRVGVTAVGAAAVIFPLAYAISSSLLSLLVVPPAGLIAYSLLALRTGAVDSDEVVQILDHLPSPFNNYSVQIVRKVV